MRPGNSPGQFTSASAASLGAGATYTVDPAHLATGISYANETATWTLLVGGGLITLANVLLQVGARKA